MAPTEMVQMSHPLPHAQPTTSLSSPNLSSSELIVTLNNAQQCACSHTLAETPTISADPLTVEHLEQLILKHIEARHLNLAERSSGSANVESSDTQPEEVVAKASRLDFKTVDELYVFNSVQIPVS